MGNTLYSVPVKVVHIFTASLGLTPHIAFWIASGAVAEYDNFVVRVFQNFCKFTFSCHLEDVSPKNLLLIF
jgi:hypothetical protein